MSSSATAPQALEHAATPGRRLARLLALNARLTLWVLRIACVCLAGLGAVVIYGVVMRYAFNDPPAYIEQVALMLVICVAMFGAAAGVHDVGHIGLDSVVKLLPPAARFVCEAVCQLLVLAFAVMLLTGGIEMAWSTANDTIPTLGISEAVRYVPPIIAGVLIILFSIGHLLVLFNRKAHSPPWN
jgi:TRAP-type C4-dicarboxylate transport system permease small subunit